MGKRARLPASGRARRCAALLVTVLLGIVVLPSGAASAGAFTSDSVAGSVQAVASDPLGADDPPSADGPYDGIGAGMPLDGTALAPSRNVGAVIRAQSDVAPPRPVTRQALPPPAFTYHQGGYTPQSVPAAALPYYQATPLPLVDTGVHDSAGVRMRRIGTTLFNHPVAQAQYGLGNLGSYQLTNDTVYLQRAIAQADRLVATHVVSRSAWYFPYPFDFALHGDAAEKLQAPWYSAMAQGLALSLFVRLGQVTADPAWLADADEVALSFTNPPAAGLPSTVHVDADQFLWLDEYPETPPPSSDLTFNGHMFALFGLFDYASQTSDATAAGLWDGALMTVRTYGQNGFRHARWISGYCLKHQTPSPTYHAVVTAQMLEIHAQSGDPLFARIADIYRADYPRDFHGTARFPAGTWTGYLFTSGGTLLGSKSLRLARASSAPFDQYGRVKGRGIYYRISAGSLAGYEVPEQYGGVRARGEYGEAAYVPERQATLGVGMLSAYQFNAAGDAITHRTITLSQPEQATVDQTAMFGGRRYAHLTSGSLSPYWLPLQGLTLT